MPTPTYDLIASSVLSSTAASVVFSSISGSYRDLILVVNATASSNNLALRFNSDSGSNYNWIYQQSTGTSIGTNTAGSQTQLDLTSVSYLTTQVNTNISQIMDYSQTDKHKLVLTRGNGQYGTELRAGRWASTSAITSITVICDSGSFSSGSTFYLYGIVG